MVRASNFFKLDSLESDSDEERNKSKATVDRSLVKKKPEKEIVNSETDDGVNNSNKKSKERKVESEAVDDDDDNGGKKSKKKQKQQSGGDEGALVNTDDDDFAKRKLDFSDMGGEENKKNESKKKKKRPSVDDSEVEESSLSSGKDGKKKRKEKKQSQDSVLEGNKNNDGMKDADQIQSESPEAEDAEKKRKKRKKQSEVEENNKDSTEGSEKKLNEDSEAEGNDLNSKENAKKERKMKKKKKQSEDPEAEENNNEGSDAEGNGLKSSKDPKKKKKKKKQSEDSEVEENSKDSTEDAEKKLSEHSEAEENDLNSNAKKERKMKKKEKKKKQSEDPEAEENNNDGAKTKKRKKEQKGADSEEGEGVTTQSSKSAKRVKFSDQVEVFPEIEKVKLSGKRFTKEEDELIKKAVLKYVENHDLGDDGIDMVMNCKSHKQVRGCWKEIAAALPLRTKTGVYDRAHVLFEQGSSKGIWSKEDFEVVIEYERKHGKDWKTLADAMGKSRKHVKDAWRRIRLASKNKGQWSREEYQNLFDLVNKDLRMKAFQEKRSKHGMLRDNIPWMTISDQLRTRDHSVSCMKWYDKLVSPMVAEEIWANVDDYRLLDELTSLDAACVDDVDWDYLLDNRDGDTCRRRWNQMVHHIGLPGTKTFAEQVEILSQRYCPDIAEDREDFDNRPFDD